ncbi:P-type conjugative transfer protein TrbL [Rhodoplanes elegans]|nr:P-type conjugative transfer protein TrbL [Rhodoplanes elegans]MBK5958423.1 P-type conjugative transfer protein TrbL [Rhodoplanes elegans]
MNTGIIDRFTEVFSRYIDSGFGLLGGEVAFLASTLIVIDITLAGLFWASGNGEDVITRLVQKTLYVGFFAFLIGNFNRLAGLVFESFAGLGLKASGSSLAADQFLQPGRIAQVGIDAGKPILAAAGQLVGYVSFFENFIQIAVLLIAWFVVLVAFFILAIQLFVTLIEFKLTTLAGFVLVPFGLFAKTAFLAERVLGNVVSSGIKVLVLAVVVGIGTTLFSEFTRGFGGGQPTFEDAMVLALGALALLGLGIFGPGIANGLVSGGPQLGAGAAVGTAFAAGGIGAVGAIGARAGVGALAGAARGGAAVSGGAVSAYRTSAAASGATGLKAAAAGARGVARAGAAAVADRFGAMVRPSDSVSSGQANTSAGPPAWAQTLRRHQTAAHGASVAAHAVRSGDHGSGGSSIPLSEDRR